MVKVKKDPTKHLINKNNQQSLQYCKPGNADG